MVWMTGGREPVPPLVHVQTLLEPERKRAGAYHACPGLERTSWGTAQGSASRENIYLSGTESLLPGFALQVAAALRAGVRVAGRAPAGQVLSAAGAGDLGVSG